MASYHLLSKNQQAGNLIESAKFSKSAFNKFNQKSQVLLTMQKQSKNPSIAIIGGGFSGTMLAINLVKHTKTPLNIFLISKSEAIGRGVAYSTNDESHLLNVPASNMSAYPDDAGHFLKWLQANDYFPNPANYYPRKIYGDYIASQFDEVKDKITVVSSAAIDLKIDNEDTIIDLANGEKITAQFVTLALGNFAPLTSDAQKALFQLKDQVIHNPWADLERVNNIYKEAEVLIIGTGLTMVDIALTLFNNGHQGKVTAISRHGKLPESHIKNKPAYELELPKENTVRSLFRYVRNEITRAEKNGLPWQSVFDSLRPHTSRLWQGLSRADKKRFMRHVRVWWDTRRHRISEITYEKLLSKKLDNKLFIRAARISLINPLQDKFEVVFKPRGSKTPVVTRNYDYIINCVTPETNLEQVQDPLVQNLLAKEIIRNGTLRMGLKVNNEGAVIGKADFALPNIFALGPIQKGELWETIAVPELRVQAKNLATKIIEAIGNSQIAREGAGI